MTGSVDRGRVGKTWRLAETLLDYLPQARQPSSTLAAVPGLTASRHVPCTACGARGRVYKPGKPCVSCPPLTSVSGDRTPPFRVKHGCHPCPGCDGTGWRRRRKGDAEMDGYAALPVPATVNADDISIGAIRTALAAQRERPEIAYAAEARAKAIVDAHERPQSERFGWEVAWERMCAQGSYAELRVSLMLLEDSQREMYRIVWHIVCLHEPVRLSESRQAFLNESMTALTGFMPEQIRVPRYLRSDVQAKARKDSLHYGKSPAHMRERRERDDEIRRLRFAEGWKVARLCQEFALSRMQVHRICVNGKETEDAVQSVA